MELPTHGADTAGNPKSVNASAQPPSPAPGRRIRRGRERGASSSPGESLVPRLGPVSEAEAEYHNPLDLWTAAVELSLESDGREHLMPDDTPISELTFVSLDCETTGRFPHRMVELGAIKFSVPSPGTAGIPRLELESLVHTTDQINPYARRVHGISRDMLSGAPSLRRVASAFHGLATGAVLIEHSADAFDTRLVAKALGRPLPHHHLDTSRMAGFLFELRDTIGLERLCERLGVAHRRPHYALADAEATADCFIGLVRLGQEQFGWRTLGDLLAIGSPPPPKSQREPSPRSRAAEGGARSAPEDGQAEDGRSRRRRRGGRRRRAPAQDASLAPGDTSET